MSFFARMGTAYFETEFVKECGMKAANFKNLTPMGRQRSVLFQVLTVVVLIGMVICFALGYGKAEDKKKELKKSTKTFFKVMGWILFVGFIPLSGFTIYKYIVYLGEYSRWYSSLSPNCQMKLNAIHGIENALAAATRNNKD